MRKVQINIYRYRQAIEHKIIEVPINSKPSEVLSLANKSLNDEQRSKNWDWNFINDWKNID